ncbi:tripartite tricarboxylate transporter permease [Chloroflexota bacterium]
MLEEIITAASALLDPNVIFALFLGIIIGMIFGVLPGLSGMTAMAVVLPFTYGWDATMAMYLYIGIMGSCIYAGSIPSILINTPGTAPNAVTCFDGHPMARKGQAGRALGISAAASGMGALVGIVILVAVMPIVRIIILSFAAPEFFWLIALGLACVALAARGNMVKGLLAAGIGIFISLIGFSPVVGNTLRYTGSSMYLWDGIELVPFVIGIFAVSEMINYSVRGGSIAGDMISGRLTGVWEGVREVFKYPLTFLRSSVIGTGIGIIPAVGGPVASFLAYASTVQTSKHPNTFGTGDPEGVLAPESANNASVGGGLLPTLAFGIPGTPAMVLLLAAFLLHGVQPGPLLLRDHMDLVWALILGLGLSNIITSVVGLVVAPYLARITAIRVSYIAPIVLVLCFTGAYVIRGNIWDVAMMVVAGVFGYGMLRAGFPIITLLMGYILGVIAERAFLQSLMMSWGNYGVFFTRPVAIVLFILFLIVLSLPVLNAIKDRKRGKGR